MAYTKSEIINLFKTQIFDSEDFIVIPKSELVELISSVIYRSTEFYISYYPDGSIETFDEDEMKKYLELQLLELNNK